MKILVTGGCGFIGSHVVESLHIRGDVIRVLDQNSAEKLRSDTSAKFDHFQGTITCRELVEEAVADIDCVIHLAALSRVSESILHPDRYHQINVEGLKIVGQAAQRAGVSRFIFASSAAVYGPSPAIPTTEGAPINPIHPYGITKALGEKFLSEMNPSTMERVIFRIFNVFGPRQATSEFTPPVVPGFIEKVLIGKPLEIHGDGKQTRDFIYVKDLAEAIMLAAGRQIPPGTYNLGSGKAVSLKRLAEIIQALRPNLSTITHLPPQDGDAVDSQADTSKILKTGWRPTTSLEKGLEQTIC